MPERELSASVARREDYLGKQQRKGKGRLISNKPSASVRICPAQRETQHSPIPPFISSLVSIPFFHTQSQLYFVVEIGCFIAALLTYFQMETLRPIPVQISAKVGALGLVKFVPAVAYHVCSNLIRAFTQPWHQFKPISIYQGLVQAKASLEKPSQVL